MTPARIPRSVAFAGAVVLGAMLLSGCAATGSPGCPTDELPGAWVSGAFGEPPEVDIDAPLDAAESGFAVVIQGSGEPVRRGDIAHTEYSTYSAKTGELVEHTNYEIDEWAPLYVGDALLPGLLPALECAVVGSRVIVIVDSADGYAEYGRSALGVGPHEDLVFVLDINDVLAAEDIPVE